MRILVLTEDGAKRSHETIQKLVREMLKLVCEYANLAPDRVSLFPLPEKDEARRAMTANLWKQHPPTIQTIRLREAIATELRRADAFVTFHADADRVWGERAQSENRAKFLSIIVEGVRQVLRSPPRSPTDARSLPTLTSEEIEHSLSKLFLVSPCYTIESWLYQATDLVAERCRQNHASAVHQEEIGTWAADRTVLDGIRKPKEDVLPCVAGHSNLEFAHAFPTQAVYFAGRSFTECVDALLGCPELVDALRRTGRWPT